MKCACDDVLLIKDVHVHCAEKSQVYGQDGHLMHMSKSNLIDQEM